MTELAIGKTIRMPCMRRGLCAYEDETILVPQQALEQLASTAYGIPVTIEHPDDEITDDNVSELSVGRVSRMDYDPSTDLWYAEFVVNTAEGVELLKNGYGVSTAWYGEGYEDGGTYNNVPFDRALKKGKYEHLAIVKQPRYEMAVGAKFLNSKARQKNDNVVKIETQNQKGDNMIAKVWKKLTTREDLKTNENESLVVEVDGQEMSFQSLVDEFKTMKKSLNAKDETKLENESKDSKPMLCGTEEIEVNGKMMTLNELVEAYKASMSKSEDETKDASLDEIVDDESKDAGLDVAIDTMTDDDKKESSDDEDFDDMENASDEEDEDDKKKNSRFNSLKDSFENGFDEHIQTDFVSTREMVIAGQSKYGSKK